MPDVSNLQLFVIAAVALAVTPGPAVMYIVTRSITQGRTAGVVSCLGITLGGFVHVLAAALGVSAALATSVLAFTIVKWLGVGYLVYLAVRQWRSATVDLRTQLGVADEQSGRAALLVRGLLVNVTNPKGLVFLLAVLPQFVVPTAPLAPQYLIIAATMVPIDLIVMGGYASLAARLLRWLTTPRQQTAVNRVFSGLFALAAVGLSLMRRGAAA